VSPDANKSLKISSQPSVRSHNAGLSLSYPFDWTGIEDFSEYRFTENGLPLVYLGKHLGWRFYPITIAQWGLYRLQHYARSREERALHEALSAADWLVANAEPWEGGGLAWVHDWPLEFYGTPAPWVSAMAQGEAISLLLRAHLTTGRDEYLKVASGALQTFVSGSVCSRYPDGSLSLEEYPADPPAHVLNGAVFASLGLFDYAVYLHDGEALRLWELAVQGLRRNLHLYDTGFWTRYDLFPVHRLASPAYHEIHIRQMGLLYELTSDRAFVERQRKWLKYQRSLRSKLLWIAGKSFEKLRLGLRDLFRGKLR